MKYTQFGLNWNEQSCPLSFVKKLVSETVCVSTVACPLNKRQTLKTKLTWLCILIDELRPEVRIISYKEVKNRKAELQNEP